MNNNSIVFLTLSMICIYFVLDEFIGKKLIESAIYSIFPNLAPETTATETSTNTSNVTTNNGNFINLNPVNA